VDKEIINILLLNIAIYVIYYDKMTDIVFLQFGQKVPTVCLSLCQDAHTTGKKDGETRT
jgi:hypothetical protein